MEPVSDYFVPADGGDVADWARRHGRSERDAWQRYAHFLTARALARNAPLRQRVVVAGGVALWLGYGNARTPGDFDLVVRRPLVGFTPEGIRLAVNQALGDGLPLLCPDYERWSERLRPVVKVRMSAEQAFSMQTQVLPLDEGQLHIWGLEDALAQKLRALCQPLHPLAKHRGQDIFDFAYLVRRCGPRIDLGRMAAVARGLAQADGYTPQLGHATRQRAEPNYDSVRDQTGREFIDFEVAWGEFLAVIARAGFALE